MNLLVDIGNTRVKWACEDNNVLFGHDAFSYGRDTLPALLAQRWQGLARPRQVHLASVAEAGVTASLCAYVRAAWNLEAQQAVTGEQRGGLHSAYDDVAALGVDRWLAMLAAWRKYRQPVCVIDCGTALTIDVVLADGRHTGGFILPGLALTATALARETHGIPEYRQQELQLDFGHSTATCISNGFACALLALLQYCATKIRAEQGAGLLFVVTGGGAQQVLSLLPARTRHEPHLVLYGLLESRRHNEVVYHREHGKINT